MPGTAPSSIGGFVQRWTARAGFKDTASGFPYGSTDVATSFIAPTSATGGWTTAEGATQTWANTGTRGAVPAYVGGPGLAFQLQSDGSAADMQYNEGTAGNRMPVNASCVVISARFPMGVTSVTDYTNPASIVTSTNREMFLSTNFTNFFRLTLGYNRKMAFGATAAGVESVGVAPGAQSLAARMGAGREIIVICNTSGTSRCGVLRGDAIQFGTVTATLSASTGSFLAIGNQAASATSSACVFEDISFFKTTVSEANALAAAIYVRDYYGTYVVPTTQLDIMGDSITAGIGCGNCDNYVAHLEARLRSHAVHVNPQGVQGADAQTWNDVTFQGLMLEQYTEMPTINRRVGLFYLGANALDAVTPQATATWIGHMEGAADKYRALTGAKIVGAVVPVGRGHSSTPGTLETRRREYRTALLASSHFDFVIDTDTAAPELVPVAATNYDVGYCAGSEFFQLSRRVSTAASMPGTTAYNSRNIGIDGIHMGPLGHSRFASMLLDDATFAAAVRYRALLNTSSLRNRNI